MTPPSRLIGVYIEIKQKMFISISDKLSTTLYLNETSEYQIPKPCNTIKCDIMRFWYLSIRLGEKKSADREHTVVVEPSGETVRWRRFRLFSVQWRHDAVQEAQHLLQEQMGEGVFAAILRASILLHSAVYLDINLPPLPISWWIFAVIGVGSVLQCV